MLALTIPKGKNVNDKKNNKDTQKKENSYNITLEKNANQMKSNER